MPIKILFLHGFFASGSCVPAQTLRHSLEGRAQVLSPDLPLHPDEALDFIRHICHEEHPTVIVGNSNGAFLAQMVASEYGMPALLGNPHLEMTEFLNCCRGTHQYKSPRADGRQELVIDQALIDEFAVLHSISGTDAVNKTATAYGDCSARRTLWHTMSRSFLSTTHIRFTSPERTHLRRKK